MNIIFLDHLRAIMDAMKSFEIILILSVTVVVNAQIIHRQVVAGDNVTLPCSLSGTNGTDVLWYGDGPLTTNRDINHRLPVDIASRIAVVGTGQQYNLQISHLKLADNKTFRCYIYQSVDETYLKTLYYEVVVIAPPGSLYPLCAVEPEGPHHLNDSVTLVCTSQGGVPPAELVWNRGDDERLSGIKDSGNNTLRYELMLRPSDNGVRFSCQANSRAMREPRFCEVTPLTVMPTVTLAMSRDVVYEDDDVTMSCSGIGMPSVTYRWYANNLSIPQPTGRMSEYVISAGGRELHLSGVTFRENATEFTCEVSTPTGLRSSRRRMLYMARKQCTSPSANSSISIVAVSLSFLAGVLFTLLTVCIIGFIVVRCKGRPYNWKGDGRNDASQFWSSRGSAHLSTSTPNYGPFPDGTSYAVVKKTSNRDEPQQPSVVHKNNVQSQINEYYEMNSPSNGIKPTGPGINADSEYQRFMPSHSMAPSTSQSTVENMMDYANVTRGSGTDLRAIPANDFSEDHRDRSASWNTRSSPGPVYQVPRVPSVSEVRRKQSVEGSAPAIPNQANPYQRVPQRRNPDFTARAEYAEIDQCGPKSFMNM